MKKRLDFLLVDRGLFDSRTTAQRAVMAAQVLVDGTVCDKPGTQIREDADISVKSPGCPFVSRGGYKLQKALDVFGIDVKHLSCIDIGSSTGGFTDCLLQRGAGKVYAVDVGTNQLAWKLRSDERVTVMERFNFRHARPEDFPERFDFACTDVSFISLKHILPPAAALLRENGLMVALIKPQFEAGREQVGRHGTVKDASVHEEVIEAVIGYAADSGFSALALDFSPVRGAKEGNIEYLLYLRMEASGKITRIDKALVSETVRLAHDTEENIC